MTGGQGYRELLAAFVGDLAALYPDPEARSALSARTNLLEETVEDLLTSAATLPSREVTFTLVPELDPLQIADWERRWLEVERAAWSEEGRALLGRISQLDRQRAFKDRDGVRRALIETLDPLRHHVPYRAPHHRARGLFAYTDLRLWTWRRQATCVPLPVPEEARTRGEFGEKLTQLKAWANASLDEIVRREWDQLARSTVDGALKQGPTSSEAVAIITEACGLPRAEIKRWVVAYDGTAVTDGRTPQLRLEPDSIALLARDDAVVPETAPEEPAETVSDTAPDDSGPPAETPDGELAAVAARVRLLTLLVIVMAVVVAVLAAAQIAAYLRASPPDGTARVLVQRPMTFGPGRPAEFDLSEIMPAKGGVRLAVRLAIAADTGPDYCVMDSRLTYRIVNGGTTVSASAPLPEGQTRFSLPPVTIRRVHAPRLDVSVATDSGCTLVVDPSGTQATPR